MSGGATTPFFALSPQALHHRLQQPEPLLLLDVRHPDGLSRQPYGIRGAVPVILKDEGPDLPDVDRGLEIVIYHGTEGDVDGRQIAQWLAGAGYRHLWLLDGGLDAWRAANLPVWQVRFGARQRRGLKWTPLRRLASAPTPSTYDTTDFLRGMVLPLLREVTVLRIGVIETTASSWRGEVALAQVQRMMRCVLSAARQHAAEPHDFEGDGTTLYFADVGMALRAAFDIRGELCAMRMTEAAVPLVRLALDSAPTTLGHVGSEAPTLRCLIGPCSPTTARILKQAPPGGIVTTARVLKLGQAAEPELIKRFKRLPNRLHVRSAEESLPVFLSLPIPSEMTSFGSVPFNRERLGNQ